MCSRSLLFSVKSAEWAGNGIMYTKLCGMKMKKIDFRPVEKTVEKVENNWRR